MADPKAISKETADAGAEFVRRLLADQVGYDIALAEFKKMLVQSALAETNGCKAAAGRALGLTRNYVRTIARR